MKKLLQFALLFAGSAGFAQFALEHDYPDGYMRKITLEYSGEKYVVFDDMARRFDFYNTDHTFWKSITLQMPQSAYVFNYYDNISESKINPDANIEIAYSYSYQPNGENVYVSKIINEAGDELMAFEDGYTLEVNTDGGLPPKLIVRRFNASSDVYSLPGLVLEHSFPPEVLSRVKLEHSGEKYYYHDDDANMLKLFNADFSPWKSIGTPMPDGAEFYGTDIVSETGLNADALLEVGYTHSTNGFAGFTFGGMVVNENGSVLLDTPDVWEMALSAIPGLDNKLLAYRYEADTNTTRVFHLPDMVLEHAYPEYMGRFKLEISGEKYYAPLASQNAVTLYNGDHSLWKSIALPVNAPYNVFAVNTISETRLTSNNSVGVAYSSQYILGGIAYFYESRVADEFGNILLTVPNAANLYLVQAEAEDKLIANINGDSPFMDGVGGQVYSAEPLKVQAFRQDGPVVFPNPVGDRLFVKSARPIQQGMLYDAKGVLVQNLSAGNLSHIETALLENGFYFLALVDSDGKTTNHKIVVAH